MNIINKDQLQKIIFTIFSFYLINDNILAKYSTFLDKISIVNIIVIICFCLSVVNFPGIIDEKIGIKVIGTICCFVILVFIGVVSNITQENQPVHVWILDFFLSSRYMFIYIFFILFMKKEKVAEYRIILIKMLKFLTTINFILLVLNIFFHFLPYFDVRYGFYSQRLLYTHPTYLGSISFFCWYFLQSTKKDIPYQIMSTLLILSTARGKLIFLMVLFYTIRIILGKNQQINYKRFFFLASFSSLLIIVFKNQLDAKLFKNESSMRHILMTKAELIANTYFPLGSGYGTYGSFTSFKYYSPIYEKIGMDKMYGFTANFYAYGMDSYYSLILAQFGYFGLISFLGILIFSSLAFLDFSKIELKKYVFLVFLITSCFTESTLSSTVGVVLFMIIALESKVNEYQYQENL